MDGDERNMDENPNDVPNGAHGGGDDDDFGEFEGFEGGIEHLQAQPAPSPWATFPDLLPVQTSPATPADEGQSSPRNINPVVRDNAWRPVEALPWGGLANADLRPIAQPIRTLNPPDVSLGTNQGAGGRVTPDNVHDAAQAEVLNHVGGGMGLDARLPVAQLDLLQQQLGDAEQSRAALEEQVDQLRQRNMELEAEVASSQAQINELSARLQQNQESLEQRLLEMRNISNDDVRRDLQQLQEEVRAIRNSQTREQQDLVVSQQIEQLKVEIVNKFQSLELTIKKEYEELEQKLLSRLGEQSHQMTSAVESIVQQSISGSFTQIVKETMQKNADSCQNSGLLQQLKVELERHEDLQRKALEEERRKQLNTVSAALQSALQHLTGAMNNTPKKEGEKS